MHLELQFDPEAKLHGAAYAHLKVGEPMARRAAGLGQAAALVYAVCFVAAGAWLAAAVDGQALATAPFPKTRRGRLAAQSAGAQHAPSPRSGEGGPKGRMGAESKG